MPFNIKQALSQITYELRICRKKSTKISPFEAHHGRKPNTALSNATTTAHKSNLDWSNTIHAYLDDNIIANTIHAYLDDNFIGQEDLISDERWEQSDLDSDREVKEAKAKKLKEAKEDNGDIPRVIKMESSKFEEPLAKTSPRLLLARKNIATTRSKKNLQGHLRSRTRGHGISGSVPEGTENDGCNSHPKNAWTKGHGPSQIACREVRYPRTKEYTSHKLCSEKDRKKPLQKVRGTYAEPRKGPNEQDYGNSNHSKKRHAARGTPREI